MAKQSAISVALSSALSAERIAAQAAITTTLANATPTHVKSGKRPSDASAYDVVPFSATERAVFNACLSVERAAWETDNRRADVVAAVRDHFKDVEGMPSFAMYRSLQNALNLLAVEAGFTGQMMRKHCAHAVKTLYGALPVSDSPAAIAKRAQRPAATPKTTQKPSAAETFAAGIEHARKDETVESFIARVGVTTVLAALNRILDAEESTKPAAAAALAIVPMLKVA